MFDGFCPEGCQENFIPKSALSFVRMMWDNSNIKQQTDNPVAQSSLLLLPNYLCSTAEHTHIKHVIHR